MHSVHGFILYNSYFINLYVHRDISYQLIFLRNFNIFGPK